MGKWSGKIGFGLTREIKPGIWQEDIIEKNFRGEILKSRNQFNGAQTINDNLIMSVRLKIISSPFAQVNAPYMKYITYKGAKWKVSSIDDTDYPRMILEIGELYTGNG